jgi:hypothetical protein
MATPTFGEAQALAGKVAWAFPFLQGGISGYHDMNGFDRTRWSLYLTRTFHSLTVLGEYAGGTDESVVGDVNSMAAFVEGVYRVSRGVNLRAKFDYVDPTGTVINVESQISWMSTWSRCHLPRSSSPTPRHPSTPQGYLRLRQYVAMLYVPFNGDALT